MSQPRSPLQIRFERLLALCKRNLRRLDDTDREIVLNAAEWHYKQVGHKGQKRGRPRGNTAAGWEPSPPSSV